MVDTLRFSGNPYEPEMMLIADEICDRIIRLSKIDEEHPLMALFTLESESPDEIWKILHIHFGRPNTSVDDLNTPEGFLCFLKRYRDALDEALRCVDPGGAEVEALLLIDRASRPR